MLGVREPVMSDEPCFVANLVQGFNVIFITVSVEETCAETLCSTSMLSSPPKIGKLLEVCGNQMRSPLCAHS